LNYIIGKAGGGGNDTKSGTPDEQVILKNKTENFEKISNAKNEQNLEMKFFKKTRTHFRAIKRVKRGFHYGYSDINPGKQLEVSVFTTSRTAYANGSNVRKRLRTLNLFNIIYQVVPLNLSL